MNKTQTIEGVWWIHGKDNPALFGILSYDPEKGLHLNVRIPQNRTNDEAMMSMLRGEHDKVVKDIQGTNTHANPITLFGCSVQSFSKGAGMDIYSVHVSAAILNYHCEGWEKASFPAVGVNFNLLTRWLNQNFYIHDQERQKRALKRKSFLFEFQLHDDLEIKMSPEVRIKIQSYPCPSFTPGECKVRQVHTLYFLFTKPLPVQKIQEDYVTVFLRLLCLLTGERIFAEEINLLNRDPFIFIKNDHIKSCELLLHNPGVGEAKHDVFAGHMIAGYADIASNFQEVLTKWFDCHARLKPVLDLYFVVLSNLVLTSESQFLLLAQALEVYHARSSPFSSNETAEEKHQQRLTAILAHAPSQKDRKWLEYRLKFSNQKPLGRRINEILNHHHAESCQLIAKIPDFIDKVVASRNYYTHYGKETFDGGFVASGLELRRLVYALIYLLQICILKEIGISGKPIETILKRNSKNA